MKRPTPLIVLLIVLMLIGGAPSATFAAASTTARPRSAGHTPKPISKPGKTPVAAPVNTDIAGRWRLDVEHSDFGAATSSKPRERVDLWEHDGAELHVRSYTVHAAGDTARLDWRCRSDGVAVTNTMMGVPVKSVGTLENGVLHVVFSASGGFGSIVTDEHLTVSPDRQTLTVELESKSMMGQYKQRFVYHPA